MKQNIATDIEQSKRLLACGVKPETADMYLSINLNEGENYDKYSTHILAQNKISMEEIMLMRDYLPAWSLSSLLDLLPGRIFAQDLSEYDDENPDAILPLREFDVEIHFNGPTPYTLDGDTHIDPRRYAIKYTGISLLPPTHPIAPNSMNFLHIYDEDGNTLGWTDESPIEACVRAIEWLTTHGYSLNNIEQ